MVIWLAGQPCIPFYSSTASYTEQVSSPSSREERIRSPKTSMMIKSWSLPQFFSLQKSHKRHMDLTSSLQALQPDSEEPGETRALFLSGSISRFHLMVGERRERSQRAFWAGQRNCRFVGLIRGCCPSPPNTEIRQVPLPRPPPLRTSFAERKKEGRCFRGAHGIRIYLS